MRLCAIVRSGSWACFIQGEAAIAAFASEVVPISRRVTASPEQRQAGGQSRACLARDARQRGHDLGDRQLRPPHLEHVAGEHVREALRPTAPHHEQRCSRARDPPQNRGLGSRRLAVDEANRNSGPDGIAVDGNGAAVAARGQSCSKLVGAGSRDGDVRRRALEPARLSDEPDRLADADTERH